MNATKGISGYLQRHPRLRTGVRTLGYAVAMGFASAALTQRVPGIIPALSSLSPAYLIANRYGRQLTLSLRQKIFIGLGMAPILLSDSMEVIGSFVVSALVVFGFVRFSKGAAKAKNVDHVA